MKFFVIIKACCLVLSLAALARGQDFDNDNDLILSRSKRNARDCVRSSFDIYFLVEVSRFVGGASLREMKAYLTGIVDKLRIDSTRNIISLTSFGGSIENLGTLNDLQNRRSALGAIASLAVNYRGRILPQKAIEYLSNNLFTPEHGRRADKEAVCVIVLASAFGRNVTSLGEELRQHCRAILVGFGTANRLEMLQIASEPSSRYTIFSRRYQDLTRRIDPTLSVMCKPPLGAPVLEVFDVQTTSVGIRWTRQEFARRYFAAVRTLGGRRTLQQHLNIPLRQNQVFFTNLRQATTYTVEVWARDDIGQLSPRSRVLITTALASPEITLDNSTITNSSVHISWSSDTQVISSYYVTLTSLNNASDVTGFRSFATNVTITGLSSGTRYRVTVSTLSFALRSEESDPVTFTTVPDPPVLVITLVKPTTIGVTWEKVQGAKSYTLIIRDAEADTERVISNILVERYRVHSLKSSQRYEFVAYTVGEKGLVSRNSSRVSALTAPTNPDDVTPVAVTTTSISVRWGIQNAAVAYRVTVRSRQDPTYRVESDITDTEFSTSGLKAGTWYRFIIYSIGRNDAIDLNVVYPLAVQTVPIAPSNVTTGATTESSIEVIWSAVTGAKVYHVLTERISGGNLTGAIMRTSNSSLTSAVVNGLIPAELYEFRVMAEGQQGQESETSVSVQDSTYAAVPTLPRTTYVNMTLIEIEFDPVEGASSYIVETGTLAGPEVELEAFDPFVEVSSTSNVVITRLFSGVWYNVTIKSKNRFGKVNPNPSPMLMEQTVPAPPFAGYFWRVTTTSLTYRWTAVKGAFSYVVYVKSEDPDKPYLKEFYTNSTIFELKDLEPGIEYEFKVQSLGHGDRRSSVGKATNQQTVPGMVTNLRSNVVNISVVELEWDPVKGAGSYQIVAVSREEGYNIIFNTTFGERFRAYGLRPGTWYNFTVHSRDASQRVSNMGSNTLYIQTVPHPPANLKLREATSSSFKVVWVERWGAIGYLIRAWTTDKDAKTKEITIRVNQTTSGVVYGLDAGTRYSFEVRSIGFQEQVSYRSELVSDNTLPETTNQPVIEKVTSSRITAAWDSMKGATMYIAEVMQDAPSNVTAWEVKTPSNGVELNDLLPGTWYNLSVYSVGTRDRTNENNSVVVRTQTVPLAPMNLEFGDISNTTIEVRWNNVVGAIAYKVHVTNEDTEDALEPLEVVDLSTTITGLEPGTQYTVQLSSIGEQLRRSSRRSLPVQEETNPDTPNAPTISEVTAHSLKLQWDEVKGARSYAVSINSQAIGVQEISVEENELNVGDLESGTEYVFSIFAIGKLNRRNPRGSSNSSVYTAPSPPVDIATHNVLTTSLELSWSTVKGAISYTVFVAEFSDGPVFQSIPSTGTLVLLEDLEPGQEYAFDIRAVGREGLESEAHPEFKDATRPDTPFSPLVVAATTSSITYDWPDAAGALSYRVFTEDENGERNEHIAHESAFVYTDLKAGTRHSVRLQSVGPRDRMSIELSDIVMQQTVTDPPDSLVVTSVDTRSIELIWEPATGASAYFLTVTSDELDEVNFRITLTSFKVTGLEAGTFHTFALQSIGDEDVLSTQATSVGETTLPEHPSNIEVTSVRSSRVDLEWENIKGAESYEVLVQSGHHTPNFHNSTSTSSIAINGLLAGYWYNFTVFSIGVNDRRSLIGSPVIIIQTVPTPPGSLRVNSITNESVSLSWEEQRGASSYRFSIQPISDSPDSLVTLIVTESLDLTFENLLPGTEYRIGGQTLGEQENRNSSISILNEITLPNRPTSPTLVAVTSTTLTLTWDIPEGALSFEALVNGEIDSSAEKIEVNRFMHHDLQPGTFYSYEVYSLGKGDKRSFEASPSLDIQTAPSVPKIFSVVEETTDTITLSWNEVYGRSYFEVKLDTELDPSYVITLPFYEEGLYGVTETFDTRIVYSSLIPGISYTFALRTVGMQAQYADDVISVNSSTYPEPPVYVRLSERSTTSITIEYQPDEWLGHTYVIVVESDVLDQPLTLTSSIFNLTVNDLIEGAYYLFKVYSVGAGDKRSLESTKDLLIQTIPATPSNLRIMNFTTKSFRVGWDEVFGALSYNLTIVQVPNTDIRTVANFGDSRVTDTIFEAGPLHPGTVYNITLNSLGQNDIQSVESLAQAATVPSPVSMIVIENVRAREIQISWNDPHGYESYNLIAKDMDNNTIFSHATDLQSAVVNDLMPGRWYQFNVVSIGAMSKENSDEKVFARAQTVPVPPSRINISDVTTESFLLTWNNVYGAASYVIAVKSAINSDSTVTLATNVTTLIVTNLSPGVQYSVTLKSVGEKGQISVESVLIKETTLPTTASDFESVIITTNSVNLRWQPVRGAMSYQIIYRARGTDGAPGALMTSQTEISVPGLQPGTWYEFAVFTIGIKDRRNEASSDKLSVQTDPIPPTGLSRALVTTSEITLSWEPSAGAARYLVEFSSHESDKINVFETTETFVKISGLNPGTWFSFLVKAIGEMDGVSEPSPEVNYMTVPATPEPPTVTDITTTEISLAWTKVKGAETYRLVVRELTTRTEVGSLQVDEPFATVTDLEPGTVYTFSLFSIGQNNLFNADSSEPITQQTVLEAPSNIQVDDVTFTSLSLSWNNVNGAAFYIIEIGSDDSDAIIVDPTVSTPETSYTFADLLSGTEYYFTIKSASSSNITSVDSAPIRETTVPGIPTELRAVDITIDSISLTWQAVKGAVSYRISLKNVNNDEIIQYTSALASIVIRSLQPGTWYEISIFSFGIKDRENPEGSRLLRRQTVPSPPGDIEVVNSDTNSIILEWKAVYGADKYEVAVTSSDDAAILPSTVTTNKTLASFTPLSSGTIYEISITAVGVEGQRSEAGQVVSLTLLPATPTDLIASEVLTTSVGISWKRIKGAASYRVISRNLATNNTTTIESEEVSIRLTSLTPGTWYEIIVNSVSQDGKINPEGSEPFRKQTIPLPPTDVTLNEISTSSFTVNWQPAIGASRYVVNITSDDIDVVTFQTKTTNEVEISVDGLLSGTNYDVKIIAIGEKEQYSGPSDAIRQQTLPARPTDVTVDEVSTTFVVAYWSDIKGTKGYRITSRDLATNDTTTIESEEASIRLNSLTPGTWYEIIVNSVSQDGKINTEGSEPLRIQTVPEATKEINISERQTTSFVVTWQPVIGASRYVVIITSNDVDVTELQTIESTQPTNVIKNISPGTTYNVTVTTVGEANQSSIPSDIITVTTLPARPTNVTPTEVTPSSIFVEWPKLKGAYNYVVTTRNIATNDTTTIESEEASIILTFLTPGTWYEIIVNSVSQDGKINPEGSEPLRKQTVPNEPENIVISEISTSSFFMTWHPVIGARRYIVTITSDELDVDMPLIFTTEEEFLSVDSLSEGKSYDIMMRSVGEEGQNSGLSEIINVVTLASKPADVTVIEASTTSISLLWREAQGAVKYLITAKNLATESTFTSENEEASARLTFLTPGTWYEIIVNSVSQDGKINPEGSEPLRKQTVSALLTDIAVSEVTTTSFVVTWQYVIGANRYVVIITSEDSDAISPPSLVTTEKSIRVNNLSPGTLYDVIVLTVNEEEESSDPSDPVHVPTLPARPTLVTAAEVSSTAILVNWHEMKGASSYRVSLRNMAIDDISTIESEEASIRLNSLTPGTWYEIIVNSVSQDGKINPEGSEPLRKQTVTASPNNVEISEKNTSSFVVMWQPVRGANRYVVSITSNDTDVNGSQSIATTEVKITVKDLLAGTAYEVTVMAVGEEEQRSVPSDIISTIALPATPADVTASDVTTTSIIVTWPKIKGALFYRVTVRNLAREDTSAVEIEEASTRLTSLTPGTWYEIIVNSVSQDGKINPEGSEPLRKQTVPALPADVRVINTTTSSFTVTWRLVTGAVRYIVTLTSVDDDAIIHPAVLTMEQSTTANDLTSGTSYNVTVIAVGEEEQLSNPSDTIGVTTLPASAATPTAATISSTFIELTWPSVKSAGSYRIVATNQETNEIFIERSKSSSVVFTSLNSGTWYQFVVFSLSALSVENPKPSNALLKQTAPVAPSSVIIVSDDVTPTSITISWDSVKGAASYEVTIRETVSVEDDVIIPTTSNTLEALSLSPGTDYSVSVVAIGDEKQRSVPSHESDVTTLPEPVSEISVSAVTTTTASLEWLGANGARTYRIVAKNIEDNITVSLETFDLFATITQLNPGTWYQFNVISLAAPSATNFLESVEVRAQTVPLPPVSLEATEVDDILIVMLWSSSKGASSYILTVTWKNDDVIKQRNLTATGTALVVRELKPGTMYNFTVRSVGEEDRISDLGPQVTEYTRPAVATHLAVVEVTTTSITLVWQSVQGAHHYHVFYRLRGAPGSLGYERVSEERATFSNLQEGTWYEFVVVSYGANERRNKEESDILHAQTIPTAPNNVLVNFVYTNEIQLSWSTVFGATSYLVRYMNDANQVVETTSSDPQVAVLGLKPGTEYEFVVFAVTDQDLKSAGSEEVTETTRIDPPSQVDSIEVSTHFISLSWEPVEGASSYYIEIRTPLSQDSLDVIDSKTTLRNLRPGVLYSLAVYSVDAKGRRSQTSSEVLSLQTVPQPPSNLRIEDLSTRSFTFLFDESQGAVTYEVLISDEKSDVLKRQIRNNELAVVGLEPGILYTCYVSAITLDARRSQEATIQQRTVPLAPSNLQVVFVQTDLIHLSWDAASGATSYDVIVINDEDKFTVNLSFNENFVSIDNLDSGTLYSITVISSTVENIKSLDNASLVQRTMPAAPTNLEAQSTDRNTIDLNWDDVKGAGFYTVYYISLGENLRKLSSEFETRIGEIPVSQVSVRNLEPGVNYTFEVTATSPEGIEGPRSESVVAMTYALFPELPHSDVPLVSALNISKTYFTAVWEKIANAVSYKLVLRNNQNIRELLVLGYESNQMLIDNLLPNTVYNVTIKAIGIVGDETEESDPPLVVKTRPLPPRRVTLLSAIKVRADHVEIEWAPTARSIAYDVTIVAEASGSSREIKNISDVKANVTGLQVLNFYLITVTSIGKFERSPPSDQLRVQARHPVPVIPTRSSKPLFRISSVTYNSMDIEIFPIEHAASYVIILRKRGGEQRRISEVQATTNVSVVNLDQNTIYQVSFFAIGYGGQRSNESPGVTTITQKSKKDRTGQVRLVPGIPVDVQILRRLPGELTVSWKRARRAIGYRVSVQNTETGLSQIFDKATSPYTISTGLEHREVYNISIISVGRYFDSDPSLPITVEMPYPDANSVRGIAISRLNASGFMVQWLPTPYAVTYTILVEKEGLLIQIIRGIRANRYYVSGLKSNTTYNVTVSAISHDLTPSSSSEWKQVTTALYNGIENRPTENIFKGVLDSVVKNLIMLLQEMPDSVEESDGSLPNEKVSEDIEFRIKLRDRVEQLRIVAADYLQNQQLEETETIPKSGVIRRKRQVIYAQSAAFESLISLAREIKRLSETQNANEATVDSITRRLSESLSVLLTSPNQPTSSLTDISRQNVRDLLFPIVHFHIKEALAGASDPLVIEAGRMFTMERVLATFVNNRTITSSGFTLLWSGFRNSHRYYITVEKVLNGRKFPVFENFRPGRSFTLDDLDPSSVYDVTIRPATPENQIIPNVAGRTRIVTAPPAGENFEARVTTLESNRVTLSWDTFPIGVSVINFSIRRKESVRDHQRFVISRAHSSVTFTRLSPEVEYVITARSFPRADEVFSITITTPKVAATSAPPTAPQSDGLVPPLGLHVVRTTSLSITLEWLPVELRGTPSTLIRYNIRVFRVGTSILYRFVRFRSGTITSIPRLRPGDYEVTISTYSIRLRRESNQSPRLLITVGRA
ncbi:titin-like isoform X4 [Clavelina lepadiformis]|uniref:titin-like isoform X4 n=1 Tax=Clavelina lepadiformis TaxID=159417 RepID=UPI004042C6BC